LNEALIEPLIEPLLGHIPAGARRTVRAMIDAGVNAPRTSSAGRLFDAVACLAGVRDRAAFEGQAAMELEGLAEVEGAEAEAEGYAFAVGGGLLDPGPVVLAVARDRLAGVAPARIAARFHAALAAAIAEACAHVRARTGIELVALTGGVFQNALLTSLASRR